MVPVVLEGHGSPVLYNIINSYKHLESDLIKHCHVISIHSLGQPLIVRSHSKVHRSRGNPKEIPTWASRVSNYSYFPWGYPSLDSTDNKHGVHLYSITIYHWICQLNGYCSVILLLPFFENYCRHNVCHKTCKTTCIQSLGHLLSLIVCRKATDIPTLDVEQNTTCI